jgi:phosphomannomutase
MAENFAQTAAESLCAAGFEVWLSERYAPTPAFSWIAQQEQALGAIVITASHNPASYLGLKVKGAFGGSVPPEITQKIEALIPPDEHPLPPAASPGTLKMFDPWPSYCAGLRANVDSAAIRGAIAQGQLVVFADAMHGAAAGGLGQLLNSPIEELHANRDPLFGGVAPEPLPSALSELLECIRAHAQQSPEQLAVGLVFDGDCDRIAAVDGQGQFLSSQILIPVLIEHLVRRGYSGEVVKTVSGSDLIPKVAALYELPVHETPIGYKYIADRMLEAEVLLGGEESGGIGYGHHIPERDALMSALYVLEAIVHTQTDVSQLYRQLQEKTGFFSAYDRLDLPLASMEVRSQLLEHLQTQPPTTIADQAVISCQTTDGYKFRLEDGRWLLIRFSGTEPVLRLYCEASSLETVHQTLAWAKAWAQSVR